jgi:hypothetical protein
MKTKPETQESSVTTAFAELGRLEHERAEFAAAKQSIRATLDRQGRELKLLRERLEAERPRALARVRRERIRREQLREQLTARLIAEAESAHDERLALIRAELEAKRLRLAALETGVPVQHPSRRWLEWSVPVAACALVAFLGFALFDAEHAVAQTTTIEPVTVESTEVRPEPVVEPTIAPVPAPVPDVKPQPEPELAPKPIKKSHTKKTSHSKQSTDEPKPDSKPLIKKNSNPLKLDNEDGNPLSRS